MDGKLESAPEGALHEDGESGGFLCPRCGLAVEESYYGPCSSCRATLRWTITSEAREVQDAAYEPKMNVTPNAVALKD